MLDLQNANLQWRGDVRRAFVLKTSTSTSFQGSTSACLRPVPPSSRTRRHSKHLNHCGANPWRARTFVVVRLSMALPIVRIGDIAKYENQDVELRGWLYNKRSSGKLHFLQVRDGSGIIQAVMFK